MIIKTRSAGLTHSPLSSASDYKESPASLGRTTIKHIGNACTTKWGICEHSNNRFSFREQTKLKCAGLCWKSKGLETESPLKYSEMKYAKYKHNGSGTEVKVEGFMPDKGKQWTCQVPESQLFSSDIGQDTKPQGTHKLKHKSIIIISSKSKTG